MATAEETSPPFLVVGDILYDINLVDNPGAWVRVKCARREAYDCGPLGDVVVNGLNLYVRAGREDDPDSHPSLCIGAHLGVYRAVGREIDEVMADIYGRDIRLSGSLYTVAGGVMVVGVFFHARHVDSYFRSYYLVYDSTAAGGALFLLPCEPDAMRPFCTSLPLKVGLGLGGGQQDKNYSLVVMVEGSNPTLVAWSPLPVLSGSKAKIRVDKAGWILKSLVPKDTRYFTANVVFLHKGNAVWGDLGQGIIYCDCRHLFGGGMADLPKFKPLPSNCRVAEYDLDEPPLRLYRNIGCVGDSIWFVIIQPSKIDDQCIGQPPMVTVWTLDLLSEEAEWKQRSQFKVQTIWELDDFRTQGLPETVPKFPIFRQQDDGILYMLLPEPYSGGDSYAHLVGIDLSSSCHVMRLVVNRRLVIPWMDHPLVLDPDFFGGLRSITV